MGSRANIYIEQSTDFRITIELFDEDDLDLPISGYSFYADMKKMYSSARAAEFEIQQANNDITLVMGNDVTSTLEPGKYQYDVLMKKSTGEISKIVEGIAFVIPTMSEV